MMSTAITLATRWVTEVINNGDTSQVGQIVAARYVEHARAPFGTLAPDVVDGPAHTTALVKSLRDQFPDLHMEVESVVADRDEVVLRVRASGTHTGFLNGVIPPTGRRFSATQGHWFRVSSDRLAEHWAVRDDLATLLQLGILEPPQRPNPAARP